MRKPALYLAQSLLASFAMAAATAQAEAWPELRTPATAQLETIASDMLLNGKRCRLLRFKVRSSEGDVLAFFRAEWGSKRVVENRLKSEPVIASRQGDYFITVQLHALDNETVQGTVMTTLLTAKAATSTALADTQKLLPAETQVISTIQTADAGKRSLLVVGVNLDSVRANRDHVLAALLQRGFRVTQQDPPREAGDAGFVSLQLSSAGEEASVTISNDGSRRAVVISRVREGSQ